MFEHHFESNIDVAAPAEDLFAELDDQERLSAHMMQSSTMMGGATMQFEFDDRRGRAVGSRMRLFGRLFRFPLEVIQAVVERVPPQRKAWETIGEPRLVVIGRYRMGFEIERKDHGSRLNVFIDYDDQVGAWSLAGMLLGGRYARWCTRNMAEGAAAHFAL